MSRSRGRRLGFLLLLALWLGQLPASWASAQEPPAEYRVKAAFLQRFLMFISWPEGDAGPADRPIVVGVVGETPLAAALRKLQDASGRGPQLVVREIDSPDELAATCDVAFIARRIGHLARTDHPRWKNLRWLENRPILTVGEDEDFLAAGGVIDFFIESDRVRFAISSGAAKRAGLTVRADLMRLAKVVE